VYPFSSAPSPPFSSTSAAFRFWREFDFTIPTALRKLVNMLRNENRNMSKEKETEKRERERETERREREREREKRERRTHVHTHTHTHRDPPGGCVCIYTHSDPPRGWNNFFWNHICQPSSESGDMQRNTHTNTYTHAHTNTHIHTDIQRKMWIDFDDANRLEEVGCC